MNPPKPTVDFRQLRERLGAMRPFHSMKPHITPSQLEALLTLAEEGRRYKEALEEIIEKDQHSDKCENGLGKSICSRGCPFRIAEKALKGDA